MTVKRTGFDHDFVIFVAKRTRQIQKFNKYLPQWQSVTYTAFGDWRIGKPGSFGRFSKQLTNSASISGKTKKIAAVDSDTESTTMPSKRYMGKI